MHCVPELVHRQTQAFLRDAATRTLVHYDFANLVDVTLVNLTENATFKIEASDGRRWALRIHREGYHSALAIESELSWTTNLRETGVVITPRPVTGRDGKLIQNVQLPESRGSRKAVLFEWEAGAEPGMERDLSVTFEKLGEITARMHLHARQWHRPAWFTRLTWDVETSLGKSNPHWGRWRDGLGMDEASLVLFAKTVDLIGKRLAAYGKGSQRFGLTHCDLRLANLLVDAGAVKVIDFDDCGFSWYMYDAATPISFHEHDPQAPHLIEHWKTGYRRVTALSREDEAEIPTFVMLRRLLLVAWIGSHRETELAKSMGQNFTEGTASLCETYLQQFG
jgi:Ser/Thr protein kinase RdoA (MazF antagonist)